MLNLENTTQNVGDVLLKYGGHKADNSLCVDVCDSVCVLAHVKAFSVLVCVPEAVLRALQTSILLETSWYPVAAGVLHTELEFVQLTNL